MGDRAWLKFHVPDNTTLKEVTVILKMWALRHSTPRNLFGAIKLWAAIESADLTAFYSILCEHFPSFVRLIASGQSMGSMVTPTSYPMILKATVSKAEIKPIDDETALEDTYAALDDLFS